MRSPENELVQRLKTAKDPDAFPVVVTHCAGMVYGTCHRILGKAARAADVTQGTFFLVFQKAASISVCLGGWQTTFPLVVTPARPVQAVYIAPPRATRQKNPTPTLEERVVSDVGFHQSLLSTSTSYGRFRPGRELDYGFIAVPIGAQYHEPEKKKTPS